MHFHFYGLNNRVPFTCTRFFRPFSKAITDTLGGNFPTIPTPPAPCNKNKIFIVFDILILNLFL